MPRPVVRLSASVLALVLAGSARAAEPEPPSLCATPCAFLAVYGPAEVVDAFAAEDCGAWPIAAPDDCDALAAARKCVLAMAPIVVDDPRWAAGVDRSDGLVLPETRARLRRIARANVASLEARARACRTSEHPTAGPVALDRARRAVSFGARSFALPRALDAARAEVVDLGGERVVIERTPTGRDADDFRWTVFAVRRGALRRLGRLDTPGDPTLPGDGTMRTRIERDLDGFDVTFRPGRSRLERSEARVEGFICSDCTACPFVFQLRDEPAPPELVGEVLRNIVGAEAEHADDLALTVAPDDRELTVVLAERKPEMTWLDAVMLELDGQLIAPRACMDGGPAGPACADDGDYDVFGEGEERLFVFDLPPDHGSDARLVADGFYVPLAL